MGTSRAVLIPDMTAVHGTRPRLNVCIAAFVLFASTTPLAAQTSPLQFEGLGFINEGGVNFSSTATGINIDGSVVVGRSTNARDQLEAFRWTATTGMLGLGFINGGGSNPTSGAAATSADGSVIVGYSSNASDQGEAFRWTAATGMIGLGFIGAGDNLGSAALDVSADGSVVVGNSNYAYQKETAFRWTATTGMIDLGFINGGGTNPYSNATAVSADGSVTVGWSNNANNHGEAFRWTAATGMVGLGFIDDKGTWPSSSASDVSADGSVIVGYSTNASNQDEAFRWTTATGMVGLGFINGGGSSPFSSAYATNADGSVVVGHSSNASDQSEAFRWTAATGMQSIQSLLTTRGVFLGTWRLDSVNSVSADGSIIVGEGTDPNGFRQAWIVRIVQAPPVPPPEPPVQPPEPPVQPPEPPVQPPEPPVQPPEPPVQPPEPPVQPPEPPVQPPEPPVQPPEPPVQPPEPPVQPRKPPVPPLQTGFINYREMQATIRDNAGIILQSGAAIGSALGDMRFVAQEQCRPDGTQNARFCPFVTGTAGFWNNNGELPQGRNIFGSAGVAVRLLPGLQVGAAFSTGHSRYKLRLDGRNEVTAYGGSAFISYAQAGYDGLQLLAAATAMRADLDISRNYLNGVISVNRSKGSTTGYGSGALGRIGWGIRVLDKTWLTPFAELEWNRMRNKGYRETGGAFPFSFDSQHVFRNTLRPGVEVRHQLNDTLTLSASAAWAHRLSGKGSALGGVMVDTFALSSGPVLFKKDNQAEFSAGASWTLRQNMRLSGSVATSFEGNRKPDVAPRVGFSASF